MFILLDLYTKVCHSFISWWSNCTIVDNLLYTTVWLTCDLEPAIIVAPVTIYCVHKEWECLALIKALRTWSVLDQWLELSVVHFMHMHIMALWLNGVSVLPVTVSTRSGMSCMSKALFIFIYIYIHGVSQKTWNIFFCRSPTGRSLF